MCTVSMIMDHYGDEWRRRYVHVPPTSGPAPVRPTPQELEEFRRLLDRAREYDRLNNEPECELQEKRQLLKDLAERLGVDISFVDAP